MERNGIIDVESKFALKKLEEETTTIVCSFFVRSMMIVAREMDRKE